MKVLYMDASNQKEEPYVVEMERYTVTNERTREDGGVQYELAEVTERGYVNWFNATRFVPLMEGDVDVFTGEYEDSEFLTA